MVVGKAGDVRHPMVPEQPLERSLRADWLESGLFSLTPSR